MHGTMNEGFAFFTTTAMFMINIVMIYNFTIVCYKHVMNLAFVGLVSPRTREHSYYSKFLDREKSASILQTTMKIWVMLWLLLQHPPSKLKL